MEKALSWPGSTTMLVMVAGFGLSFEGFYRVVHGAKPTGGGRLMIPIRYIGIGEGVDFESICVGGYGDGAQTVVLEDAQGQEVGRLLDENDLSRARVKRAQQV